jgi:transcriptional regulator with XRE-family HTH domain
MNKTRRQQLKRAVKALDALQGDLLELADVEKVGIEKLRGGLRTGPQIETMQLSADALNHAADGLDRVILAIEDASDGEESECSQKENLHINFDVAEKGINHVDNNSRRHVLRRRRRHCGAS